LFNAPIVNAGDCGGPTEMFSKFVEPTITVRLPVDSVYINDISMLPDSVVIPNGRPIYALFVHGYQQNINFNLLLCYNFAKRLMQDGAYVHWSWWNNLCAEYMGRPLHRADSHPGVIGLWGILAGGVAPDYKAIPVEDYQFQADAKAFLKAIRDNNPSAIIIVLGHSMGGAAVTRLGSEMEVVIDILAPLDPVGNRSRPWIGAFNDDYHNWTRHRIAREDPVAGEPFPPATEKIRTIKSTVVNLFHRYQIEASFPMDFNEREHFNHTPPPGGTSTQRSVTCWYGWCCCGNNRHACTMDGHGEIVGFRGVYNFQGDPDGMKMLNGWPTGRGETDRCKRRRLILEMPILDRDNDWIHRPWDPDLCLVSEGLISLYESMNRPPVADAGGSRTVAHSAPGVKLDGSASTDPDGDNLTYTWRGALWEEDGQVVTVPLGVGTHEITLTVKDPSGHINRETFELTVVDRLDSEPQTVSTRMVGAYPNPFNATTTVVFELAGQQDVSVQIFDLRGRLVRTLEEGTLGDGRHEKIWDGRDDAGRTLASGAYFVRVRAGDRSEFSKILLLK
jgi:pimeloyl-ACP methyl ester carboxylesterase